MKKLWKKITGLFFASVMAVTLTGKANAENDEAALPEPAPTAAVEPAAEAFAPEEAAASSETAAAAEPSAATEDLASAGEETSPVKDEAAVPEEDAVSSEEAVPAEDAVSSEETVPAEDEFSDESEAAQVEPDAAESPAAPFRSVMTAEESESEVTSAAEEASAQASAGDEAYRGTEGTQADPAEDVPNQLVLTGNIGTQTVNSPSDITIKTAGVQHISSLVSDGDVYIVGTGILLVDNLDLLQGRGVYLQSFEEIYGQDGGTAALFVLTGEEDGIKTYTLYNGTAADGTTVVPAVLDEEYVIPEGVNLVVPEGGSLLMQAILALAETQGDTTVVSYSLDGYPKGTLSGEDVTAEKISTAPVLTIAHGAGLVIDRGADFCLAEAGGTTMLTRNLPQINVQGELTLNGDAKAETFGGADIVIADSGDVSGSGCFFRCTVSVQGDRSTGVTSLGVSEATLWLDEISGSDICALRVEGNATIRYKADFSVDTVCVNNGILSITNEVLGAAATMTVTQGISGTNGSIRLEAGELVIPDAAACSIPVRTGGWMLGDTYRDEYFDGSERWDDMGYVRSEADGGTMRYSSGALTGAPLVSLVGEVAVDGAVVAIPVADGNCTDYVHSLDRGSFTRITGLERAVDDENEPLSFTCPTGEQITYASLIKALGAEFPGNIPDMSDSSVVKYEYLVLTYADGAYGYVLFDPAGSQSVAASDVVQICRMVYLIAFEPAGGATTTSTNTAYTGSGILGGSGAGSVSGGPRRLALTGNRGESAQPAEDDPLPDDPEGPAGPADVLRIWTSAAEDGRYELHFQIRGESVTRLAAPMTVRMAYTPAPGEESKPLYAVFRDAEGKLAVFEARFDPVTGSLVFDTDMAGCFLVVAFEFDGDLFSEDFFLALADLAEIKALLA